ncbi:MAG: S41 family peptidase [Clostridia bacterium]|nr:S41 family peptidase [Clostridia bacterium]
MKTRNIVIIACLLLILVLVAAAVVVAIVSNTGEMGARDDIIAAIEEYGTDDLGHRYVANHLLEYGIGGFDAGKFRNVEYYFDTKYVKELPSVPEMAKKTAELFMEYYYDRLAEMGEAADRETVTTALITCFVEATGDRYAVYRTPEELSDFSDDMSGTFVGIGVSILQTTDPISGKITTIEVEEVLPDSGAGDAGILPGDFIIAVGDVPVTDMTSGEVAKAIRGEVGTKVKITVLRGGVELDYDCVRKIVVDRTVRYDVEGDIGYITITSFKGNTASLFLEAIQAVNAEGVKGIVFDVRNNPGGYLDAVLNTLDVLVPKGTRLASYKETDGTEVVYNSVSDVDLLNVPVTVICNRYTASAGELFTAALRDYDAMGLVDAEIIGETTYGKGVMQTTYPFFDGSSITLTNAYYNPPSNVNYDGKGIEPKDEYKVDLAVGSDTQLAKAIEVLRDMIGTEPDVDDGASI